MIWHLIILDGYESHVTLKIIQKTKKRGLDMINLPSYTSHALLTTSQCDFFQVI